MGERTAEAHARACARDYGAAPGADDATRQRAAQAAAGGVPVDLGKMTAEDLLSTYERVLGRGTKSTNRNYLIMRIREALRGNVRIGARVPTTQLVNMRMTDGQVSALDESVSSLGLAGRTDLFRRALTMYLDHEGEHEAAALFFTEG